MDQLAPTGPIYQAGTLSGNPLAMSAGIALIETLIQKNPFDELEKASAEIMAHTKNLMNYYSGKKKQTQRAEERILNKAKKNVIKGL